MSKLLKEHLPFMTFVVQFTVNIFYASLCPLNGLLCENRRIRVLALNMSDFSSLFQSGGEPAF